MAVILKNSVILHIPKTGGQYVRSVLDANNIGYYQTGDQPCTGFQNLINRGYSSHCLPLNDPEYLKRTNRGCFLRHPLTWYQSYWSYRVRHGHGGNPNLGWRVGEGEDGYPGCILDEATHSDDFQTWIDNVIEFCQQTPQMQGVGVLTLSFDGYLSQCVFVGKVENVDEDLANFLWWYEKEVIPNKPERSNVTEPFYKGLAKYRKDQVETLMGLEQVLVTQFGYDYIPKGVYEEEGVTIFGGEK